MEAETKAAAQREAARSAELRVKDVEDRVASLQSELEAQRHANLTSIEHEQRIRASESEELRADY